MAATYITALVIKHNNDVFFDVQTLTAGVIGAIPTPGAGASIDGDFWAVPITGEGVVSGFDFVPCAPDDVVKPTAQSFHVFRLYSRLGNDSWYARGTTTSAGEGSPGEVGYIEAAADAECCSDSPGTLPITTPVFAPCQLMCTWNAGSKYFAIFALPVITNGLHYFPYGYFNDVLLTAATAHGYATADLLLTFLTSNWSSVGTWSYADAGKTILQVVQTSGPGTDVLCVNIAIINQSA